MLAVLLDATIAALLWPMAVMLTCVGVAAAAGAVSGGCDAPCDGPYLAAVGVGSVVVLVGWVANVAFCVSRKTTPARMLIAWTQARKTGFQPPGRTSPHS